MADQRERSGAKQREARRGLARRLQEVRPRKKIIHLIYYLQYLLLIISLLPGITTAGSATTWATTATCPADTDCASSCSAAPSSGTSTPSSQSSSYQATPWPRWKYFYHCQIFSHISRQIYFLKSTIFRYVGKSPARRDKHLPWLQRPAEGNYYFCF